MADPLPTVQLSLWRSDAIVLFDWLSSVDLNAVPITHPAQKQALTDLSSRFETDTKIPWEMTQQAVAEAQAEVARDMGW